MTIDFSGMKLDAMLSAMAGAELSGVSAEDLASASRQERCTWVYPLCTALLERGVSATHDTPGTTDRINRWLEAAARGERQVSNELNIVRCTEKQLKASSWSERTGENSVAALAAALLARGLDGPRPDRAAASGILSLALLSLNEARPPLSSQQWRESTCGLTKGASHDSHATLKILRSVDQSHWPDVVQGHYDAGKSLLMLMSDFKNAQRTEQLGPLSALMPQEWLEAYARNPDLDTANPLNLVARNVFQNLMAEELRGELFGLLMAARGFDALTRDLELQTAGVALRQLDELDEDLKRYGRRALQISRSLMEDPQALTELIALLMDRLPEAITTTGQDWKHAPEALRAQWLETLAAQGVPEGQVGLHLLEIVQAINSPFPSPSARQRRMSVLTCALLAPVLRVGKARLDSAKSEELIRVLLLSDRAPAALNTTELIELLEAHWVPAQR